MKCTFCTSCMRIKRVEWDNYCKNYFICYLCGRVYYNDPYKAIEVLGDEAEMVRNILGLTKIGDESDEHSS